VSTMTWRSGTHTLQMLRIRGKIRRPAQRAAQVFDQAKAAPFPGALRTACSNALRTIFAFGILVCRANSSNLASRLSGILQLSVVIFTNEFSPSGRKRNPTFMGIAGTILSTNNSWIGHHWFLAAGGAFQAHADQFGLGPRVEAAIGQRGGRRARPGAVSAPVT